MSQQSHLRPVDSPEGGTPKGSGRAQQRTRAGRALPTDRMKLDLQFRVLHTIAKLSAGKRPVDGDQLGRAVGGLAPTTVILSNRFFADAGWIENSRGQYTATDALVEYGRRRALGDPDQVSDDALEALRIPVRQQSWFWRVLAPYLAEGKQEYNHVALILMTEAQADEHHMPMITNLIGWLRMIGLITVENEQVSLAKHETAGTSGSPERDPAPPADKPVTPAGPSASASPPGEKPTAQTGATSPPDYVIAFDIRMTRDDFARLDPEQVKTFMEAFGTVVTLSKGT